MSPRRLLLLTSFALLLAGGAVVAYAVMTPGMALPSEGAAQTLPSASFRQIELRDFQGLLDLPLRPVQNGPTAADPALSLQLMGTVMDTTPQAIVKVGNDTQFVQVGDTVGGAKIMAIEASRIEVEFNGTRQFVEVKP